MSSLRWTFLDIWVIAWRNLVRYVRVPSILVGYLIQPIMFFVLFVYVFGGAISGSTDAYIDFLLPGILFQTVLFGTVATAVGLSEDLNKGMVDRYRSLPMARSAVIAGRIFADTLYNVALTLLMLGMGFLFGFRFHTTFIEALAVPVITVLGSLPYFWIAAYLGVLFRNPESVQMIGFTWMFPLIFVSSAFVPVETMPSWLQPVAENNPFTLVVDGLRALSLGTPVGNDLWMGLAWSVALTAIFVPLAVSKYRRS